MTEAQETPRQSFSRRFRAAVALDPRLVGVIDYGSGAEGRADEWSDVDLTVFVRDEALAEFTEGWQDWAAGFGKLLLAYVGRYEHPWAVYDTAPLPLRVDFYFAAASRIEAAVAAEWTSPVSAEAMVWHDASGGRVTAAAARLVGRATGPADERAAFEALSGDCFYFLLAAHGKLGRGEAWTARQIYQGEVIEALLKLLRLEAGATDRWTGAPNGWGIERALSSERLEQLAGTIALPGDAGLRGAMLDAARLGREVAGVIGRERDWAWPAALADRVVGLLRREAG